MSKDSFKDCIIPIAAFSLGLLSLTSCVSQDKYDSVVAEKDQVKKELYDAKFGAPVLLDESRKLFKANDFSGVRAKIELLVKEHPESVQASEGKQMIAAITEEEQWSSALASSNSRLTKEYISTYPNGKYIGLAGKHLKELIISEEKEAFAFANAQQRSPIWKTFLETYPDRADASTIKKRIIELEVDEIMGNTTTGKLPDSEMTGYANYSGNSNITISNDTGCELVIRYSGDDVKMITIPAGGNSSVTLSSGNYKIAASACGSNYAGTETLQGSYTSKYYIVHSRY